jgi:hypothetical protein
MAELRACVCGAEHHSHLMVTQTMAPRHVCIICYFCRTEHAS